jgi:HSP20 family molecular chaperone IbpA
MFTELTYGLKDLYSPNRDGRRLMKKYLHSFEHTDYKIKVLDTNKLELTFDIAGYDPKTISVETNDNKLFIKSTVDELPTAISKEIDYEFTIHKDYDTSKVNAEIKNGVLVVTFDKKEDKLNKKIEIKH